MLRTPRHEVPITIPQRRARRAPAAERPEPGHLEAQAQPPTLSSIDGGRRTEDELTEPRTHSEVQAKLRDIGLFEGYDVWVADRGIKWNGDELGAGCLTEYKAQKTREGLPTGPEDPLLTTATGKPRDRHNIRQRVLAPVIAKAEELLAERGGRPLPQGITPHKLRHTFASILVAIDKDPAYVMHQLGHTDPAFTLRVYTHIMRHTPQEREALRALVEGHGWTPAENFS